MDSKLTGCYHRPVVSLVFSFMCEIMFLFKCVFRWFVSNLFIIKVMTAHSTILAWRIPWTEEPGELQSVGVVKTWTLLIE